jgi:hypothetical protein
MLTQINGSEYLTHPVNSSQGFITQKVRGRLREPTYLDPATSRDCAHPGGSDFEILLSSMAAPILVILRIRGLRSGTFCSRFQLRHRKIGRYVLAGILSVVLSFIALLRVVWAANAPEVLAF